MRNSSVAAAAPVAAALLALGLVAATGLSQRSDLPDWLAPRAYGFFLDSYPLFAFALAYGLARLVAAAAAPGPAGVPRRAVWGVVGIAALLLASLYPTFGGVILRGAYGTGSMAFLTGQPLWLAYALGAAVAAFVFGTILGLFGWLAAGRLRPRTGWRARIGFAFCGFLALWFAAALLGLGRTEGIDPGRTGRSTGRRRASPRCWSWPPRAARPRRGLRSTRSRRDGISRRCQRLPPGVGRARLPRAERSRTVTTKGSEHARPISAAKNAVRDGETP